MLAKRRALAHCLVVARADPVPQIPEKSPEGLCRLYACMYEPDALCKPYAVAGSGLHACIRLA